MNDLEVRSDSNGLGRWSQPFNYPSREETMGKGEVCHGINDELIMEELIKMTRDWKGLDGIPLWVLLILIVMIVIAFLFIICFVR